MIINHQRTPLQQQHQLKSVRQQYQHLLEKGVYAQYEHNYELSVVYFTRAIALLPLESEAYLRRALAYHSIHSDSPDHAIHELELALDVCRGTITNSDRCVLQALLVEFKERDVEKARFLYEEAIRYDSFNYFAVFSIGYLYDCDKKYEKAIECYEMSLTKEPKYTPCIIYNNIGRCYELIDKREKEMSSGNTVATAPDASENSNTRDNLRIAMDYYTKAINAYDRCFLARQNRSKLLAKQGQTEQAQADIQFILQHNPHHYNALCRLADILFFNMDQKEKGIETFKRIQQIHPTKSYPYRVQAAYESIARKDQSEAFSVINRGLRNMLNVDQMSILYLMKAKFHKKQNNLEQMDIDQRNSLLWPETYNRMDMKLKLFQPVKYQDFPNNEGASTTCLLEVNRHHCAKRFLDIEIITQD